MLHLIGDDIKTSETAIEICHFPLSRSKLYLYEWIQVPRALPRWPPIWLTCLKRTCQYPGLSEGQNHLDLKLSAEKTLYLFVHFVHHDAQGLKRVYSYKPEKAGPSPENIIPLGWWESHCWVLGFVGKFLTYHWTLPASWGIQTPSYRPIPSPSKNTPIESLHPTRMSVSRPFMIFQHLFYSCLSNPYMGKTWLSLSFGESESVCSGLGV